MRMKTKLLAGFQRRSIFLLITVVPVVCVYSDSVFSHSPGKSSNNILHFKTVRAQAQQVLHPQKQVEAHARYWQIRKSKPIVLHSLLCFLRVMQGATRVKHDVLSWLCQTNGIHVRTEELRVANAAFCVSRRVSPASFIAGPGVFSEMLEKTRRVQSLR